MAFYDISEIIECDIAREEVIQKVRFSLEKSGATIRAQGLNTIDFRVPIRLTVTRGNVLQGISEGKLIILETKNIQMKILYQIAAKPIRLFILLIILVILASPILAYLLAELDEIGLPVYLFQVIAVLLAFLVYIVGRRKINGNFIAFLQGALNTKL